MWLWCSTIFQTVWNGFRRPASGNHSAAPWDQTDAAVFCHTAQTAGGVCQSWWDPQPITSEMMVVKSSFNFQSLTFPGLTEPVLIRLDVDSKLSDQIKVKTQKNVLVTLFKVFQLLSLHCSVKKRSLRKVLKLFSSSALVFSLAGGWQVSTAASSAQECGETPGADCGVCSHEASCGVHQGGETQAASSTSPTFLPL